MEQTLYYFNSLTNKYPELNDFIIPQIKEYSSSVSTLENVDIDNKQPLLFLNLSLYDTIEQEPRLLKHYLLLALLKNNL